MLISSKSYTISFLYKKQLTADTYEFYFKKPLGFDFQPGQYNRWTLPIIATDGRGSSRFFTIASSPLTKDVLMVTPKIIQSDFKKALLELKENDEIKIFGPMGQFVLDEKETRHQIFIAGGIGITPFYSMLTYASQKELPLPLTLFASYATVEEMLYFEDLKKIESKHPTIKTIYTITRPEKSQKSWRGETGRISEKMIKKYITDIQNTVFYIVGPPKMVEGIHSLLTTMRLSPEQIRTEQFTGY